MTQLPPKRAFVANALALQTFTCQVVEGMSQDCECHYGTKLRKWLSEGSDVPPEFSRPEVLEILREYYASVPDDEKVEVKLAGHSAR